MGLIGYMKGNEQEAMLGIITVVVILISMISKAYDQVNRFLGRDRSVTDIGALP